MPYRRSTEADLRRADLARKLFATWTAVKNPDLLAGLWNNLNAEDRRYWLESADRQLEGGSDAEA